MKRLITILTILLTTFGSSALVMAQSAQDRPFSLITSPLPIGLSAEPGQTVSTELRVKNNGSQNERLKVSLFKFSVNETSEVKLSEKQPGDDFIDWASFSPNVFEASPGEWHNVKMTIAVPKTAAFGYYYAVGFSRADAPKPQPGAATLEGQVITFVLLDVKSPNAKRELKVDSLSTDRSVYEFLPTNFTIKLKNTGNTHVSPTGNIFITRGKKTVATLSLNPNQGNVLPNSTRSFTVDWSDGFPVYGIKSDDNGQTNGKSKKELQWDFERSLSKFRIGRYTAHMVLVYDDGTRDIPVEAQLSFWVIPWRIILVVVLLLLALGWFIYRYQRMRKRLKNLKENGKEK